VPEHRAPYRLDIGPAFRLIVVIERSVTGDDRLDCALPRPSSCAPAVVNAGAGGRQERVVVED
jgi:hypothetical protein